MVRRNKDSQGSQGILFCSFCGKNQNEVRKLVAGPAAYICDECIELCRCIVEEECEQTISEDFQKGIPEPKNILRKINLLIYHYERQVRKSIVLFLKRNSFIMASQSLI